MTTALRSLIFHVALVSAILVPHGVDSFSIAQVGQVSKRHEVKQFATQAVGGTSNLPDRADKLIEALWGSSKVININRIASACSNDVVWEDMTRKKRVQGKDEVYKLLKSQFPRGTAINVDRVSDGANSSGFTWTRESNGKLGLRGTTYLKLDDNGKIESVKELAEPLVKPGDLMLKLLQAATKNVPRPEKNPTFDEENPTNCSEIIDYIWNRAYPGDAPVDEALKFYSPGIIYQDFNYPEPIVGLTDVEKFCRDWGDFPGIEFKIEDLSEGDLSCCFTWSVRVNGKEGTKGISFYETDGEGKITYIRDTPAPTMMPIFGKLARVLRPKLRTFRSRKGLVDGI